MKVLNPSFKGSRIVWAAALAFGAALTLPGCTKQQMQGTSSSYIIIDQMVASRGNTPDEESGTLDSDVASTAGGGSTVFPDLARLTLRLGLKDPGSAQNPSEPTSANFVTVTRYHVVPYEFDGSVTATIRAEGAETVLTLVRAQSKLEAPLMALRGLGGQVVISTIAEVTLYGKDQAGRDTSVVGLISVNFADWAG
jgi:hypothetical protein